MSPERLLAYKVLGTAFAGYVGVTVAAATFAYAYPFIALPGVAALCYHAQKRLDLKLEITR